MFKFSGKQPANLGAKNGKLAPVINKPNNVSSQADANDRAHYVAPFKFTGDAAAAFQKLVKLVQAQPRASVIRIQHASDGLRGRRRVPDCPRAKPNSRALGGSARLFRSRREPQAR